VTQCYNCQQFYSYLGKAQTAALLPVVQAQPSAREPRKGRNMSPLLRAAASAAWESALKSQRQENWNTVLIHLFVAIIRGLPVQQHKITA